MSIPTENIRCKYRYDALDRLTSHSLSGASQHQRFYCKSRLATEIKGANSYSVVQHENFLLAQQQRESEARETSLLATDLQRSVLHTLKQSLRQAIAYTAYGHHRPHSDLSSLLGFNGERNDPVTGHYLLGSGYREFNPVLMRFNSSDSLSPFGKGGLNSYAYCKGDPMNFTDPSGAAPRVWLSSGYKLKARFTRAQGTRAFNRLDALEDKIHSLRDAAQRDTYLRDSVSALAQPITTNVKTLKQLTIEQIGVEGYLNARGVKYGRNIYPQKIIVRAMDSGLTTHREMFEYFKAQGLEKVPANNLKAKILTLSSFSPRNLRYPIMFYSDKLTSTPPSPKLEQLQVEASKIRDRYFTY